MAETFRCVIMGAAGRDFHDFLVWFRERPQFRVVAFTAAQIPFIESRRFPRELAGPDYDSDIPIHLEGELPDLIRRERVDWVFLAYSDLRHLDVMHVASLVQAAGASFALLGPRQTQLTSRLPVVAVTAVRTGAGKSPLSQHLARELTRLGQRVAVLRHPMPYGDLQRQAVQRLASLEDLERHGCTIEEREEYEPYIEQGLVVFAGVDYRAITALAEQDHDLILWDGGNNDFGFLRPTVQLVVVDALRPGHEVAYYPGETNLRMADIVVLNKVGGVDPRVLDELRARAQGLSPTATLIESDLELDVEDESQIRGRRVVVVEDGPTVTHGEMGYGAGTVAARRWGAAEIIDPRPHAVGTLATAFSAYPHLGRVVPALGYSPEQRAELSETLQRCGADCIVDASPCQLDRLLELSTPVVRVRYRFQQVSGPAVLDLVRQRLD